MKRAMRDNTTDREMIVITSSICQLKNKIYTDENTY
jgi:hypothetical protein